MALQKVTYTDNQTVIGAKNLNDIQDAIIDLENSGGYNRYIAFYYFHQRRPKQSRYRGTQWQARNFDCRKRNIDSGRGNKCDWSNDTVICGQRRRIK